MKTTFDELLAYTTVLDTGSVTAAAAQLGLTVSGVSRALGRLEEKLQTTLLRRTTRRIELTEEGALFLAQARAIIAALDAAEEQIALRRQQPAGRLRINAAAPFMLHVIVPLVDGFRARYPAIALELNTDDLNIDLLEQRTDVAIRIGTLDDSTLHARALGRYRLRVLASPAYLKTHGKPRTVAALAKHALLGFTQPGALNDWPLRHALGERLAIAPSLHASSGETLLHLALAGQGIVCLADFMTAHQRRAGALVQLLMADTVEVLQPVHALYYSNTQLAARIACFLDYLADAMRAAG